jgi:GntR family transcriptional regulator, transcriptional repressor for pyruvate dehydrogenase complex
VTTSINDLPDLRFHRLAEQVADHLRRGIISGEFVDGGLLPKVDELLRAYPVSKPTLREAMRILEAEGLITVRRGRFGGCVVHRPTSTNLGYTLGLVLASKQVTVDDVAVALRHVEPACAALCAGRRDRARTVVPKLRALHRRYVRLEDDVVAAVAVSREFHEGLVSLCGNQSLIAMAGALESLWSSHEQSWAHRVADTGEVTLEHRRHAGDTHLRIIELIAAGEADAVRELVAEHLAAAQRNPKPSTGDSTIDPVLVRDLKR